MNEKMGVISCLGTKVWCELIVGWYNAHEKARRGGGGYERRRMGRYVGDLFRRLVVILCSIWLVLVLIGYRVC